MTALANILLMEDDADQRELISDLLELDGHEVTATDSADAAWEKLASQDFDLVITDLLIARQGSYTPEGGISLIGKMRIKGRVGRVRQTENMPILVITGADTGTGVSDIKGLSEDLGADMVLQKPVRQSQLSSAVKLLLSVRRTS